MNSKITIGITAIGLFIILVSCSKDGNVDGPGPGPGPGPGGPTIASYFPLQVGQHWTYQRTSWYSGGNPTIETYTQTIIGDTTVMGSKFWKSQESPSGEILWLANFGGELGGYDFPMSGMPHVVFLKEPLQVGNTWMHFTLPIPDTIWASIVQLNDTVHCPNSDFFDCIHVHADPHYDAWFKPMVGNISGQNANQDSTSGVIDKLLDYVVSP